jgi:outer membrane protein assembly factor BamB
MYFLLGETCMKRFLRSKFVFISVILVMIGVSTFTVLTRQPVAHAASGDWQTYLFDNTRSGYNGSETIINQKTAPHLKLHWTHTIAAKISAEPVEANGMMYWGSWDGLEHASRLSDGTDAWTTNLGTTINSCSSQPTGVASTANISSVPIGGVNTSVDFVGGGGNATFYALNAITGAVIWQTVLSTQPGAYNWSSPAVFNNSIYIGIASLGDCPLVQGQLFQLDASSGAIQHTFKVVPDGCLGASIWSSPTIDKQLGVVYVSTGNEGTCSTTETMADAVVAVNATDLSLVSSWQVPRSQQTTDGDFGATPTLFNATIAGSVHKMVGMINKNGIYYALDRTNISAGPLWQKQLAAPASPYENNISSSAWDGTRLYVSAAATTINGKKCKGSLRALNPASGAFTWQVCLSQNALDPVIAVPGLAEIGDGTSLMIVNASTGVRLFAFQDTNANSNFWGTDSISNGVLYAANKDGKLYAFGM